MRLSMKRKGTDFGGKKGIWEMKDRMHAQSPGAVALSPIPFWNPAAAYPPMPSRQAQRRR